MLKACATLEVSTRLSPPCCDAFVAAGAAGKILHLIKTVGQHEHTHTAMRVHLRQPKCIYTYIYTRRKGGLKPPLLDRQALELRSLLFRAETARLLPLDSFSVKGPIGITIGSNNHRDSNTFGRSLSAKSVLVPPIL